MKNAISIAKRFVNKNSKMYDFVMKSYSNYFPKRYSNNFWEWYAFLLDSQWWDKNRIEEYQLEQIRRVIKIAYENVPFYSKLLKELSINPKNIQDFNDLKKLPFSDRHLFMNNSDKLYSNKVNKKNIIEIHTSGTTGNPLIIYKPHNYMEYEFASICSLWKRVGYEPNDKLVLIRGDIIADKKPYMYTRDNRLYLSPNKFSKERVLLYLKLINNFSSKYILAYPSAICLVANIIIENNLVVPFKLNAIFLGSEPMYEWQRIVIKKAFNCRIFSHYGQSENVALAGECENSRYYHFVPQYSYVEIDEITNEIIGTSFMNTVSPLIRHRTKDIAVPLNKKCQCERNGIYIEKVEGRQGDFLVSLKNEYIAPQAVTWIFVGVESIKESKIWQHQNKTITIEYSTYKNIKSSVIIDDISHIKKRLIKMMGGDILIRFQKKEYIERGKRNKFRWINSEVSSGIIEKGGKT
jgi:phenylacetate-CoA ligase